MEARMAIADIVLCIDPTTVAEGRLKLAVNLAQAHKAHLNTCYIMPEERGALIGTGIAGAPVIPDAGHGRHRQNIESGCRSGRRRRPASSGRGRACGYRGTIRQGRTAASRPRR